jgi:integrase
MTVTRARDIARERISGAKNGEVPEPQIKGGKPTLRKFILDQYAPWTETHHKSGRTNANRLLVSFSEFADTRIDQLTAWRAEKWKAARKAASIQPSTINRDVLMLKAVLNKAVEWDVLEFNPMAKVKAIKGAEKVRVRYLSHDEETRLWATLEARNKRIQKGRLSGNKWREERGYVLYPLVQPEGFADYLCPMVIVSINTGLRYGELSSLTWADTRLTDSPSVTVEAAHAKSGKVRHVPLNLKAADALKKWRLQQDDDAGLVFKSPAGAKIRSVRTAWKRVLKDAGIVNFRWHDLRHHFAIKLVMAGVDLNTVRELLGHASLNMTLRYAHLAPEHKAAAVALLE